MWTSSTPRGEGSTPEQIAKRLRRINPPDNEVPTAVGWAAMLGRSTDAAVALVAARAYSTGVQLDLVVRIRHTPRPGEEHHVTASAFGHRRGEGADPLLLGVEYADGRIATNALGRGHPLHPEMPDSEPWLNAGGGSGSGRGADMMYFLSPVPPPGPFAIYCAWLARGIAETRTVLDATLLSEAVHQVQELWPWQLDSPPEPTPAAPPNLPQGGWFAATLRPDPKH